MIKAARWALRLLLCALGVILAGGIVELGLRAYGFHFDPSPIVEFGWPGPITIQRGRYRIDPDLFWVPKDYEDVLRQAQERHPAIAFLGDSCTQYGTYPQKTLEILKQRVPELATGMSFGVGGWSSEQGRKQLEHDVIAWHPRVVTIYFGWNDHWVALGPPDPEVARFMTMARLSSGSRLLQLYLKFRFARRGPMSERPNRVDPGRYEANLATMVRNALAAGITPVLITAPSNLRPGTIPPYMTQRTARTLEEIPALHEQYVQITRKVAQQTHATLCDAARAFETNPVASATYFRKDNLHLSDAGDQALAELLADCIQGAWASRSHPSASLRRLNELTIKLDEVGGHPLG